MGELGRAKGWLTEEDVMKILILQEEPGEKFGIIAIKEKFLTKEQVEVLLQEQEDSYILFGEALIQLGILSEGEVMTQLKEFNKLKVQNQLQV